MIPQDNSSTTGQAINVGIYGCTKAGKTRFLFQLLNNWKEQDRLLPQSEQALTFLGQVRTEINKHDGSMPTVATTEGIRVKVRRDGNDPPLELVFRDLRGELLSEELDQIASLNRNGVIPTQVRQCDAFLFFFDPASSENPADIDKHHQRELKRATMFIEYVLKVRENRHLPIVFVLAHLDRWDNDANICGKADCWVNEVHTKLNEQYDSGLRRFHPKSIVDQSRIFFRVSSVGKTPEANAQLEKVIEQLSELVADSVTFQRRHQKRARRQLIAGVVVVVLFLGVIGRGMLSSNGPSGSPKNGSGRIVAAEMSEQDILDKLGDLDRMLKAHPRGAQLPSDEEKKKFNDHLTWLAQRLDLDAGGTGLSEKTMQRMRSAYWQLQRAQVVEQVASIIKGRHEVGSSPIDTLGEVVSKLRGIEKEIERCKVFGSQAQKDLLNEIQTAATFCDDRLKSTTYAATIRITGSLNKADERWRNLRLQSPGQTDDYSREGIGLKPTPDAERTAFSTKQPEYTVILGLGVPVKMVLSVHEGQQDDGAAKWTTVKNFDVTEKPAERGPLEPFGLPLHNRDSVTKHLQADGHDLQVTLSKFSPVPDLLWEAAASSKERKP